MNQIFYLIKQALSQLKYHPSVSLTVIVTMAISLGVLSCIATLSHLILMKPLPYPQQSHLYQIAPNITHASNPFVHKSFSYPGILHYYRKQSVLKTASIVYYSHDIVRSHPAHLAVNTAYITPEWFSLFGIKMALGRSFDHNEALDTHHPVAILSYETWQNEFLGDPQVINQTISLRGQQFRIIGVLSSSFIEPQLTQAGLNTQVWLPWDYNSISEVKRLRWAYSTSKLKLLGRLKDGISSTQAELISTPIANQPWQHGVKNSRYFEDATFKIKLTPLKSVILGDSQTAIYLLMSGILGLFLIAASNITHLLMARTAQQQHAFAINTALGARKKDLFITSLFEIGLLMLFALPLSLAITSTGFAVFKAYFNELLPRIQELSIDASTLISAIILSGLCTFIFSKLCSNTIDYHSLNTSLQSAGKGIQRHVSKRIRQFLMISQIAIATTLIFANLGLFKNATDIINQPLGYQADNIMQLKLADSGLATVSAQESGMVLEEIKQALLQLPQVKSVSLATPPLWFAKWGPGLRRLGMDEPVSQHQKFIDQDYFQLIGQPLLSGDYFSQADIQDNNQVMIINDVLAERIASNGHALGMTLSLKDDYHFTVVGIVKGVQVPNEVEIPARFYIPINGPQATMMIKLEGQHSLSRTQLVTIINNVTDMFNVAGWDSLSDLRNKMLTGPLLTSVSAAVLTLVTILLASIGLYGILNYSTTIRRSELGTHMALGARRKDIIRLVTIDNLLPMLSGILIGSLVVVALYVGFGESFTAYLSKKIIPIFIVTLLLISSLSLLACYWPLRSIIRQPVINSLRNFDQVNYQ